MTCLDIGQDLIEVARARLNNYKNVHFVLCPFENWDLASKFDLVIAATAFRWVDPRVRFIRARDTLKARGSLAIFSNQHVRKDEGFFAEVQEVYAKHYVVPDSPQDPSTPTTSDSPEPGTTAFADPIHRVYPWTANYSAEQLGVEVILDADEGSITFEREGLANGRLTRPCPTPDSRPSQNRFATGIDENVMCHATNTNFATCEVT